ncbi:monooxygenase-like protein [Chaetomium strumarium]|uniref:Monooxygenase-like protein n=1 Tax=Chaetomium strumarium TaxID=1170767 RepID=A0AAJ0GLU9_9PEZI|nr:monooxygenase-like protein [Chaetomium strumarium]
MAASDLIELDNNIPPATLLVVAALLLPFLILQLRRVLYPTYDPREPPVLRPKIPLIGHAFSIVWEGGGYFQRLYEASHLPICTLPVLDGKLYLINSVPLISAGLRSQNLSFDPFIELFSKNALGVSQREMDRFREDPGYLPSVTKAFHPSLSGEPLRGVAGKALGQIAAELNRIGRGGGGGGDGEAHEIPNVADWLRDVMSQAIMMALYGSNNPVTPDVLDDVWEFDKSITVLTLGLAPRWLAPRAVAARRRIRAALRKYYMVGHDQGPDVSAYVRIRAASRRQIGVDESDLVAGEVDIPWTSLINTIPSLAWVFTNVFSRSDYVARVRQEVLEATTVVEEGSYSSSSSSSSHYCATIRAAELDKKPFLGACFQEVQRLYNKLCGYRRVLEDTVLRDADGREYLLKKGNNAQWFHGVPHLSEEVWGPNAKVFNPERFIATPPDEEKKRRGALIPFGGGKHLCPGRRFAVTEVVCMVGAVSLLFDVEGVTVPAARAGYAGCAMAHPAWDTDTGGRSSRVSFRRRRGWEDVKLQFAV